MGRAKLIDAGTGTESGVEDIDFSTYPLETRLVNLGLQLAKLGRTPQQVNTGVVQLVDSINGFSVGAAAVVLHNYWRAFPEYGVLTLENIAAFFESRIVLTDDTAGGDDGEGKLTARLFENRIGEQIVKLSSAGKREIMDWLITNHPDSAYTIAESEVNRDPEFVFCYYHGDTVKPKRQELLSRIILKHTQKQDEPDERAVVLLFQCYTELNDKKEKLEFCRKNSKRLCVCQEYLLQEGNPEDLVVIVAQAKEEGYLQQAYLAVRKLPNTPSYHKLGKEILREFIKEYPKTAFDTLIAQEPKLDGSTALQLARSLHSSGQYLAAWNLYQQTGHAKDKRAVNCAEQALSSLPEREVPTMQSIFPEPIVWKFLEKGGNALVANAYLPSEMSGDKTRRIAKSLAQFGENIKEEEMGSYKATKPLRYIAFKAAHRRTASLQKPNKRDINYRTRLAQKMAELNPKSAEDYFIQDRHYDEASSLAQIMEPSSGYALMMRIPEEERQQELCNSVRRKLIRTDLQTSRKLFEGNKDNAGLEMLAKYIGCGFSKEIISAITGIRAV